MWITKWTRMAKYMGRSQPSFDAKTGLNNSTGHVRHGGMSGNAPFRYANSQTSWNSWNLLELQSIPDTASCTAN